MSSVPAWKRLGLKLKGPAPATAPNPHSSSNAHRSNGTSFPSPAIKRSPPPASGPPHKKARYDPSQTPNRIIPDAPTETPAPKKRKSVSFAPDTKLEASTPSATWTPATTQRQRSVANGLESPTVAPTKKTKPKKKKKKGPPKNLTAAPAPKLEPALAYLRCWKNDRSNWKFNKNHQTSLLRHVFSPPDPKVATRDTTVPAEDISTLLEYVRDLKGFVRSRLRETAQEARQADMAPYSSTHTGFPEGTTDVAARQAEYDDLIQTFLSQPTTPGLNNPRYSFSETDFYRAHPDTHTAVARRVVKRMRAEMVLDAITSDSDASEASSASHETEASNQTKDNEQSPADKRVKLNDGTLQRVKRKRKIRTAEVESDSSSDESTSSTSTSSESESDNDADSESEGSEEDAQADADDEDGSSNASASTEEESSSSEEESDAEVDTTPVDASAQQQVGAEDSSSEDDDDDDDEEEEEEQEESSSSHSSSSSESDSDDETAGTMDVEPRENLETSPSSESSDDGD